MSFQSGFLWGAGSSAYQTEGAWNEDGKGLSIWDEFCHSPKHIRNEETGDISADSYHKFDTDLTLIRALGLKAYRFSVSWPRVFPDGRGRINEKGLSYYDSMVDRLISSGITPFITLYHWDLPLTLEKEGGWGNPNTVDAFIEYAAFLAKHFDGRVKHYITLNEPQCFLGMGYGSGIHAPGKKLSDQELVRCIHHALLAHGGAVAAMRAHSASPLEIGLATTGKICYPAFISGHGETASTEMADIVMPNPEMANIEMPSPETLISDSSGYKAAYDATFSLHQDDWTFSHTWLLDAAVYGRYPDSIPIFRVLNDTISEADRRVICEPMDFIGLNIYNGIPVDISGQITKKPPGFPRTALKWPVTPECMYYGPHFLYKRYGLPILITENGQSCNDRIFLDGAVHDPDRIDFLTRYLMQLKRAVEAGIPVKGYFHWSLTDNFEWHSGYDERFGLIYIDYETQNRIIKDSGHWYREMIKSNGNLLLD